MANVLVVEDNQVISQMITFLLENEGHEVVAMYDGNGMQETIRECCPDVILMDIRLGDVDGRDLCAIIKQTPSSAAIPVILMSAGDDLQLGSINDSCKPNDFIAKPFNISCLINKVNAQLS